VARPRPSANWWGSAPRKRASRGWSSIAAASPITAASKRWPMGRGKRDWSSNRAIVKRIDPASLNLKEQVVAINRVTKVVKGGKNLSFSALIVIGDPAAKVVGYGVGKAKEVPRPFRKGIEAAKKNLRRVHVLETTSRTRCWANSQLPGAVEAGAPRHRSDRRRRRGAVITACGVPNVLTKSIGRRNPHNVVKATIVALESLRDRAAVAELRGIAVEKL